MAIKDMRGLRFGRLLVLERDGKKDDGTALWKCSCDCGRVVTRVGTELRAGRRKSCGCGMSETQFTNGQTATHGMSRTRTYKIWQHMLKRCSAASRGKSRRLYYERGIRVCDRWLSFDNFHADMGEAPHGMSIDRINSNGNYEPGNCRWASHLQQANNTRSNVRIEFNGTTKTVAEWARHLGVKSNTLTYRLRRGIPLERAMTKTMLHVFQNPN